MEIYLDGIGLIKESTIKLEGLTVITGENNSGKSTVGKALYAIADGMVDIDLKYERDELSYSRYFILNKIKYSVKMLINLVSASTYDSLKINVSENINTAIYTLLKKTKDIKFDNREYVICFIEKLTHEINAMEINTHRIDDASKTKTHTHFKILQEVVLEACDTLKQVLTSTSHFYQFKLLYINYILKREFAGEIQPVKNLKATSNIRFSSPYENYFQCTIKENSILNKNFKARCFDISKVIFIDNAFILDELNNETNPSIQDELFDYSNILNKSLILTHKEKLIEYLNTQVTPNITFEIENAKKYSAIKEKIATILPGDFKSSNDGLKYVHDGVSLKAINLATGSKMFAIIKMILDRYGFDDRTMLILDEPEAHLHPKWQNMFAEVIVLLVKELGVRVLLTSHSTHFVLALDAHMRKHEIIGKTNFYQTEIVEDGFVQYQSVNDDLGAIYDDFAAYFAESKYMRDKYLYGDNE